MSPIAAGWAVAVTWWATTHRPPPRIRSLKAVIDPRPRGRRPPPRPRSNRRTADRIRRELLVAIDLLALVVGAGIVPRHAVTTLAEAPAGPVRAAFAGLVAQLDRGATWADALRALEVLGPAARPLATVLANDSGGPITASLVSVADDLADTHRRELERRARRLPVTMLGPLVLCVLPAFVLLTIVPVVIQLASGTFSDLPLRAFPTQ